jgi:hypothetical protein
MNGFVRLNLRNTTTGEITQFDYEINILSHVVKLMIDDIMHTVNSNDPYDVKLVWTNALPIDDNKFCLHVDITEKDYDIHHTWGLYYQSAELMHNLQMMLFTIVNDVEIDFTNKNNLCWEVLTW